MSSGVTVADETKSAYQAIKMHQKGLKKRRCSVFKLSDDLKEIVVDSVLTDLFSEDSDEKHFETLISQLPKDDGRYLIYDFNYTGSFGPSSKMIMVLWCPSSIPVKKKMVYASSKDSLKKACPECVEFQADCCEDLCEKEIQLKLCKV